MEAKKIYFIEEEFNSQVEKASRILDDCHIKGKDPHEITLNYLLMQGNIHRSIQRKRFPTYIEDIYKDIGLLALELDENVDSKHKEPKHLVDKSYRMIVDGFNLMFKDLTTMRGYKPHEELNDFVVVWIASNICSRWLERKYLIPNIGNAKLALLRCSAPNEDKKLRNFLNALKLFHDRDFNRDLFFADYFTSNLPRRCVDRDTTLANLSPEKGVFILAHLGGQLNTLRSIINSYPSVNTN